MCTGAGAGSGSTGFRRRFGRRFGRRFREKVWEALVQSQLRFNRVPEKVPEKVWEVLVQAKSGSTGFRRRFGRRFREKVGEALVQPGQVQPGSGEGSGEGLGGFGAKPGQVQQGSEEVSEALVQSQVRFNRVPKKVPEKVWEALVQSQVSFNRICGHLIHGKLAEVFPALGFAARFRKICKNKTLRRLGIPPMLIFILYIYPIGSMYAIYGNIYHQSTPNVSIYTIHGSYGYILYIYIHPSTDLPRPKAPRRVQVPQEVTSLPKPRSSSSPGAPNFFAAAEVKWVW